MAGVLKVKVDGAWQDLVLSTGPPAHKTTHQAGGADPLTALDAGILTAGTLPDARLSANVARRDQMNTFTHRAQEIRAASPVFDMHDTTGPADARAISLRNMGGVFAIEMISDAGGGQGLPLQVLRNGAVKVSGSLFERGRTVPMGEWQAYTPVFSVQDGNFALGNGSTVGLYTLIGKTCTVSGRVVGGSTTTWGTGLFYVSVPVVISDNIWGYPLGHALIYNGTNGAVAVGQSMSARWYWGTTGEARLLFVAKDGYVREANPWAFSPGTPHQIQWFITYQIN